MPRHGVPEPRDPRAWDGWREILEILSRRGGALAARLPLRPAPLEQLAATARHPAAELARGSSDVRQGIVMDLRNAQTAG